MNRLMMVGGHAVRPHTGLGCACPAVHPGLGKATVLTSVVDSQYFVLAATIGAAAISVWALAQQQGTAGKVVFGVTASIFALMAVARIIEAL